MYQEFQGCDNKTNKIRMIFEKLTFYKAAKNNISLTHVIVPNELISECVFIRKRRFVYLYASAALADVRVRAKRLTYCLILEILLEASVFSGFVKLNAKRKMLALLMEYMR